MSGVELSDELLDDEIARFAQAMCLSLAPDELVPDEIRVIQDLKRSMKRGLLSINDAGEAVVNASSGAAIVFRKPKASDIMSMSRAGDRGENLFNAVATITGTAAQTLKKLPHDEWRPLLLIMQLFL